MAEPVTYTEIELESYIPAGWALAAGDAPLWDGKHNEFRFRVLDTCDLDWDVAVPAAEVSRYGRIEALRRAIDRLFRERFESMV